MSNPTALKCAHGKEPFERCVGCESDMLLGKTTGFTPAPPSSKTVSVDREQFDFLLSEVEAVMEGEHGVDWADHFAPLFGLVEDMKQALQQPETNGDWPMP